MADTKKEEIMQLENASDTLVCPIRVQMPGASTFADNLRRPKMQRKPNTTPGSTTSLAFENYDGRWIFGSYLSALCKILGSRNIAYTR
jgi:hypothetical protein